MNFRDLYSNPRVQKSLGWTLRGDAGQIRQRLGRRQLLLFLLVALATSAGPSTSVDAAELSAPAAASWSSSRYDLIVRGEDGLIYHKYWSNGSGPVNGWTGWGALGAPPVGAASSPTVTSPGANVLQVFVRGGDNRIWNNHWTYGQGSAPGGWSGWGAVPNTGNSTWAPAATNGTDNQPDVFYTGTDNATYYTRYDSQLGWVPPVSLGGVTQGSPAATTTSGGRMQITVRGGDNRVYLKFADSPAGWTGWGAVPNAFTSMSPALSTADDGQANVFFRGLNNATLYHEYWNTSAGWIGPGAIPGPSLVSSPGAARLHIYYRSSAGDVLGTHYDPTLGWVTPSSKGQPTSDGKLYREQNSPAVYFMQDGARYWVSSPEVAQAAGFDLSTTEILPDGSLASIPRGNDITLSSLNVGGPEPDEGTATAAGSSWKYHGQDNFTFYSTDGRAKASGTVKWYHGKFPYGFRHRGDFTSSSFVSAYGTVPCIWTKVKWGYPAASVSFPPSGSISGAEENSEHFVKCRSDGWAAPDALSLYGLGFAKGMLNSVTVTACSSNSRAEGPRFCSNHKMTY